MAQTEKRNAVIYINGVEINNSLKSIQSHAAKLRAEFSQMTEGTEAYNKKLYELRSANATLLEHKNRVAGIKNAWNDNTLAVQKSNKTWENLKFQLKSIGIIMLGIFGVSAIFNGFRNVIQNFAQLSDQVANVQKTTNLTGAEMTQLQKNFKTFNTRTPRAELLKLAEEAGRQGKNTIESVTKFVSEMDKIKVALGDELGEETISQIGKLSTIFQIESLKIANAVKVVADNSIASAPYQIDFMMRTAGIANTVHMTADELMGYGAALENLGQSQEVSGTAINQFLIKMTSNTEKFGEIAGFAKGELSELIGKEGTNAGFIGFLKKLKESSTGTEDLIKKLNDLGLDGTRNAAVLLTLANNTELVTDQQKLLKGAIGETDKIMVTYNRNNQTFGATLDRLNKKLGEIYLNNPVTKMVQSLVVGFTNLIAPVKSATEQLEDQRVEMNGLVTAITNTNTSTEDRKKLITELNDKYPDFLKNMDAEKVTNEELRDRMKEVNDEFIKKIALQTKADEYQKMAEEAGKMEVERFNTIKKVNSELQKAQEKYGVILKQNLSLTDQVADVIKQLDDKKNTATYTNIWDAFIDTQTRDINALQEQIQLVAYGTTDITKIVSGNYERGLHYTDLLATKYTNLAAQIKTDYDEMKKTFNMLDNTSGATPPGTGGTGTGTGETEEEKAAREAREKQIKKDIENLNDFIISKKQELALNGLDADEKEIQAIKNKYQKEIDLAKGHAKQLAEITALMNEEIDIKKAEQQTKLLTDQAAFEQEMWLMTQDNHIQGLAKVDEFWEAMYAKMVALHLDTEENLTTFYALWKQAQDDFNNSFVGGFAKGIKNAMTGINNALNGSASHVIKYTNLSIEELKKLAAQGDKTAQSIIEGLHGEIEAYALAGNAAAESVDIQKLAIKDLLNEIRKQIKAEIAKAIAAYVGNVLIKAGITNPFLAIPLATTAGFAASALFEKILPKFADGGLGPDHAQMYVANEKGPEYIIPNWQLSDPWVANAVGIMENARQAKKRVGVEDGPGAVGGGGGGSSSVDASELKTVMRDLTIVLKDIKKNGLPTYLYDQELWRIQKRMDTLNNTVKGAKN